MVSDELLREAKARLRVLHISDDEYIKTLISSSIYDLRSQCGFFDVDSNLSARELVLERVRYAYNDSLEYFNVNFRSKIIELAFCIAGDSDDS